MKLILIFTFIWTTSTQAAVSCLYSVADLVRKQQDWFEVVIPTERGFEFQVVHDPVHAQKLLSSVPEAHRKKIEDSLNEVADHYQSIIEKLKAIAIAHHTQLQFRMKDPESIRNKIIDRAQSYQRQGRIFQLQDLHDIAGARLVVDRGSALYSMSQSKKHWAQLLKIPQNQILKIEIKGNSEDQAKGKYYRAVHLIIAHESGVRFELQVLTKAIKHWHRWDHGHVYKNTSSDKAYLEKLKNYSVSWVKIIRLLEDLKSNPESKSPQRQISEIQRTTGVDFTWANWPFILDGQMASHFEISFNDRLLVESNKNKSLGLPSLDRKAIKDLGNLTITQ
jgi:ppGpp synthetase/RelA/SpoT-type nucleotidyltranferase